MTTEGFLVARARRTPHARALTWGGRHASFGELAERTDLVARRLATAGVGPGDRVVFAAAPSPRVVEVVHAVQRLGATLVPINTRLTATEARALLAASRPALVLHDPRHADLVAGAGRATATRAAAAAGPALELEMDEALDRLVPAPPSVLPAALDPATVHAMLFTSGTTGRAKAAMLTHASHHASATAAAAHLGLSARDHWLLCMPLFHVGGLSILLRSAVTGFAVTLHERFDAAAVNRTIVESGVTVVSVVPTMLVRLLDDLGDRRYPPSLRCVLTGGGPLPGRLHARARARGVPLVPTYGLTEAASQVATGRPGTAPPAPPWVGWPLAGTAVRIVAPDADGVGEIAVRGPTVMQGYFADPSASAAVLRAGWLHTGDLGRLEPDGALTVRGRRTDLIVTGGENVHPAEVEDVLCGHPAVADAAVYGVADDEWGERVTAAVVPADGSCDVAALRAWCALRLARFKVPRTIELVAVVPRTASGKLARRRLGAQRS